ncbi:hypothetical protein KSMBR1_3705 [Candidatus Kuenenia stuttgartiensis]|uniref:Uncharacterized protein n=1 Tax=Kuenenia stuttgartiensis TaxID=174633 RepID=A0A2C9CKQ7_KUEST|nr:hypothetical protein KSMBR1_3705 [Candidatus Kuenenia stuttgartiensis]
MDILLAHLENTPEQIKKGALSNIHIYKTVSGCKNRKIYHHKITTSDNVYYVVFIMDLSRNYVLMAYSHLFKQIPLTLSFSVFWLSVLCLSFLLCAIHAMQDRIAFPEMIHISLFRSSYLFLQ